MGGVPRWLNEGLATQNNPHVYDKYKFVPGALCCSDEEFLFIFGENAYRTNRDLIKIWLELNVIKENTGKSEFITKMFEDLNNGKTAEEFFIENEGEEAKRKAIEENPTGWCNIL